MEDGGMAMPAPEMIFTVFGLKLDPKIDDAAFSLKAPEGFTKTEPEMPGFMAGAEGEEPGMPELTVKVGDAAPDFTLTDLGGKEVTLASLKGKVVLLDFWATWCGPCKAAMPTMQKLHDDYKDKGVVILGVNTWEQEADAAKAYMTKKKFTYGCLLKGDELAAAYGVRGIPTLVVIGKDGKVAEVEVGLADPSGAGLRKVLDAALAR
jgi:thiol-disulfide isomerase/thioredoxin